MDKLTIEKLYNVAILDFKTAHSDNEKWDARRRMANLERTSAELYGFEYADNLSHRKDGIYG